jgi:hypothetical protein
MLLYLTSNARSGLIDNIALEKELTVKKLIGKFSLRSFVTKDMRNYATAKYFLLDCTCVDEQLDDFTVALQSFQMMFSARIIVILSGCANIDGYTDRLISIGVMNIITADTSEAVSKELSECLSDKGMQKFVPRFGISNQEQELQVDLFKEVAPEEIIKYKWRARNIRIAVAGAQRRSGVTVTAFNFAAWLVARGAEVCYVEMNTNRHLNMLIHVYDVHNNGEHYTIDGIDCYLTNELDHDYNFIIYDCGEMQTPTTMFKNSDIRLLCGSILPHEIPDFHKVLSACGGLKLNKIGLCVPKEYQDYCVSLFGEEMQIADASHDLFSDNVNGHIYHPLIQDFITGTKK